MKKQENRWLFESYDEIRDFMSRNYPTYVFIDRYPYKVVRGEDVIDKDKLGCPVIGPITGFPVDQFVTLHNYVRRKFTAPTLLEAFYLAGDDLARELKLMGGAAKSFTAAELDKPLHKGGPDLIWPDGELELLYTVTTPSSAYSITADRLFRIIDHMEKAEGVGPARRRRFAVSSADGERKVVTRLLFNADKVLPKLRKCWASDELRPVMNQPAIEVKTGTMVASNGHILAAHKLRGYSYEGEDNPMFGDVLVPREVTQMKGVVTVEVEVKTFRDVNHGTDGKDVVYEYKGLLVTATDEKGKHGEVRQIARFPNWRSVIPTTVGKPVSVDAAVWTDGVKRVLPNLCQYSYLMRMDAMRGADAIRFSGEDYDFSKKASVDVPVSGGVMYGLWIGVKATQMIDVLAFGPTVMHFTDPTRALLFLSDDTLIINMPMLINDSPLTPRGPQGDKEMMRFSVDKWIGDGCPAASGASASFKKAVRQAAKAVAQESAVRKGGETTEMTIEDRLRAALRRQLAMAA